MGNLYQQSGLQSVCFFLFLFEWSTNHSKKQNVFLWSGGWGTSPPWMRNAAGSLVILAHIYSLSSLTLWQAPGHLQRWQIAVWFWMIQKCVLRTSFSWNKMIWGERKKKKTVSLSAILSSLGFLSLLCCFQLPSIRTPLLPCRHDEGSIWVCLWLTLEAEFPQ